MIAPDEVRPPRLGQGASGCVQRVEGVRRVPVQPEHQAVFFQRGDGPVPQGQAPAAGDDEAVLGGQLQGELQLQRPEAFLAVPGENVRDGAALTGLDEGVGVGQGADKAPGQQPAHSGLSAAHHTD